MNPWVYLFRGFRHRQQAPVPTPQEAPAPTPPAPRSPTPVLLSQCQSSDVCENQYCIENIRGLEEICTMADLPNKQEFALKHAESAMKTASSCGAGGVWLKDDLCTNENCRGDDCPPQDFLSCHLSVAKSRAACKEDVWLNTECSEVCDSFHQNLSQVCPESQNMEFDDATQTCKLAKHKFETPFARLGPTNQCVVSADLGRCGPGTHMDHDERMCAVNDGVCPPGWQFNVNDEGVCVRTDNI